MTPDVKGTLIKIQTTMELGFKRIDEKLDSNKEDYRDKCLKLDERLDKHEKLFDKITQRLNGLSWKVVGWVMAGVSIPIILGVAITRLF